MSGKKINELFELMSQVVKSVDIDDFINHLEEYQRMYNGGVQNRIIDYIIEQTCRSVDVPIHDVLYTKFQHGGKRVMSIGIISFFIKSYFPDYSYDKICTKLKNNVSRSNLQKYRKKYFEIYNDYSLDSKQEEDIRSKIEVINLKIIKFIENEKLRSEKKYSG